MLDATFHRSRADLTAALPNILSAPAEGPVRQIVVRPDHGVRRVVDAVEITAAGGVAGDHWAKGCWLTTDDGRPHPDVQICLMMARMIEAIAGPEQNWPPAGDNLFVDMDLTPRNLPPGTEVVLGTARMVITAEPHKGCSSFVERYGREACAFVNTGPGAEHKLRGIYARVLTDGIVRTGDVMRKA